MNMRKASKLISLLLTAAMAGTLLAGCGNSGSSGSGSGSAGTTADSAAQTQVQEEGGLDTSEEVELVMYVISNEPAKQQELTDNMNKLFKEKLNCTLKINYIGWAEYANKYPLLFFFRRSLRHGLYRNMAELFGSCKERGLHESG